MKDTAAEKKSPPTHTTLYYILGIVIIVFVTEVMVMFFLAWMPVSNIFYKTLLDSALLVIVSLPFLYKFIYLPYTCTGKKLQEYSNNLEKVVGEKVNELRKMDSQYSTILENSNDIVVTCGPDMKIVFWNYAAEEIFGYTRDEAVGKEIILIVPEKYRAKHSEGFSRFVQSGKLKHRKLYEVEGLKKDGTIFPVEISMSHYESGGRHFVTAIMRDITERRHSEAQIKHQFEKLTALRNIDMAISSSLDIRVTFNVFLEQVTATLKTDAANILLLNPHSLLLEYVASRGFRTKALQHTHLRLNEGHAGRVALEGRVICIPNLKENTGNFASSPLLSEEDFVVYCCAPLISKGNIKGVLEIFYRKAFNIDRDFLDFLESLALQAAIAIDNVSTFNNLQRANIDLALAYDTTMEGWSHALDLRDRETEGHSQRVAEMTVRIGRAMKLSESELDHVRRGALLHDIGKMGVPDAILLKPGQLTGEEWVTMKKHPVYAQEFLSSIAYLRPAMDIPYCHHEKWDGSGYPRGIKGKEIPLPARIFAVVDVYDALHNDRPYRLAWSEEKIREYIRSLSGKDFDPQVVDVFLEIKW